MSESKPFTLAVVKGASRGQVLRTDKRRITVGSARDNDLSINDDELSARHFLVLIDHGRWRIHTFAQGQNITVDRRWSHPTTGDRGAVITAARTEILLYPGHLEAEIIDREVLERTDSMPLAVVTREDQALVTQIGDRPVEFNTHEKLNVHTQAVDTSTLPTVIGGITPEDLRLAAKARLAEQRGETAAGLFVPGSDQSAMTVGPHDSATMPTPATPHGAVKVEPSDTDPLNASARSDGVNAWGDSQKRELRSPLVVPEPSQPEQPPPRARDEGLRWQSKPKLPKVNAWGDPTGRALEQTNGREQARSPLTVPPIATPEIARILAIEELAAVDDPAMAILRDPDGEMATSIRLLGTRIEEFMRMYGYRAYMLTSPEPLTGKTTTAANLALALAEDTHRRIALVEANFRFPRFAEIFGIPEDYGLIPLLEGQVQLPEAIAKLADRNLVILPAGGRHPSPAELLSSPRFKALIAELANTVDLAIIDAPAVTPFADANILLPLVDAALLVVSEKKTHANWIARAQKQLGEARILGAVYNRIPKAKMKTLRPELKERRRQAARG